MDKNDFSKTYIPRETVADDERCQDVVAPKHPSNAQREEGQANTDCQEAAVARLESDSGTHLLRWSTDSSGRSTYDS